jgi:hypothetical protein
MIADRKNNSTHLMTAEEARWVLREMEQQVPNAAMRRKMAAFYATNVAGRLSPEAVAVYTAYAASK